LYKEFTLIMEDKIKELAEKYNIPEDLFKEALEEEKKE